MMFLANLHFFLRPVAALSLVALTVAVHSAGLAAIYRVAVRSWVPTLRARPGFWAVTWVLVRFAWLLTALHMLQIVIWGVFYWATGCMPDAESAFYFSGVTYSTVGYGDLVLPRQWRMLGPVEGLTGILMCGLSTGFFFALVSRLAGIAEPEKASEPARESGERELERVG